MSTNSPRLGIALGAGAARGWAHIGVLRAIQEAGLNVHCVAGASAGALVGGVYCAGRLDALEETALCLDVGAVLRYFSDITFRGAGIVDGEKIVAMIRSIIGPVPIQGLPIPFAAVATDLEASCEVVFTEGDAAEAIRASISFPGIFTPVEHEGRMLIDGGLMNPVPVSVVRMLGADKVIAVDVNHGRVGMQHRDNKKKSSHERFKRRFKIAESDSSYRLYKKVETVLGALSTEKTRRPAWFDVLGDSIKIMESRIAEVMLAADPPDLLIRPDVGHVSFLKFNMAAETIQAGYDAARVALQDWA